MEGVDFRLMNALVSSKNVFGKVRILSSKSELHRMLLMSALSNQRTLIQFYGEPSQDVLATANCLNMAGAKVVFDKNLISVTPIKERADGVVKINCKESGSTLRFILPIFSAMGLNYQVEVEGRLSSRPLSPLYEIMAQNGVTLSDKNSYPLNVSGRLNGTDYVIDGSVSSQFITGLLMALPLSEGGGRVTIIGEFQSKPYVDITVDIMRKFGVEVKQENNSYVVSGGGYISPKDLTAGGDWSNTAFFACLGAISGKVQIEGLDFDSKQGDKRVADILSRFGAKVSVCEGVLTVCKNQLNAIDIDVKDIPDLVPALAVVASVAKGVTTFFNGQRLRLKESDRIKSTVDMINSLGGNAKESADGLIIQGRDTLEGGTVDGYNDHRIVMASAIACAVCKEQVKIMGAQAVNKSFPQFFNELQKIGVCFKEI